MGGGDNGCGSGLLGYWYIPKTEFTLGAPAALSVEYKYVHSGLAQVRIIIMLIRQHANNLQHTTYILAIDTVCTLLNSAAINTHLYIAAINTVCTLLNSVR